MKIELEHLAPYLPYNLKVIREDYKKTFLIHSTNIDDALIWQVKPILKPIIDLENLIYREFKKYNMVLKNRHSSVVYSEEIINLFSIENTGFEEKLTEFENFNKFPYECVEYMFRNHYDVFGLIEKELAISIHDVGYSYNDEDELIIDSSRTKEKCNVCSQFLDIDNECPTGHRQT